MLTTNHLPLADLTAAADHFESAMVMTEPDLEAPGRHAPLSALCGKLHAILVGRAAADLLEQPDRLPTEAGLWVAPSWGWLHSRISVGRKDRAPDGSRLRLPVRLSWSDGPVQLLAPDDSSSRPWVLAGMGHAAEGEVPVTCTLPGTPPQCEATESGLPIRVQVPARSHAELVEELSRLVEEGAKARWESLLWLEPYIDRALLMAHASVSTEMSRQWGRQQPLLDETKLKAIADRMLLGDVDHPGKVSLLLDRCLRPDTFLRVEPVRYIKESLRRDANNEVRRALGDPHIGAKVRRVAHELGSTDLDEIIAEYRTRYPSDRLSRDRAEAALSVAPDAMASWQELQAGHR